MLVALLTLAAGTAVTAGSAVAAVAEAVAGAGDAAASAAEAEPIVVTGTRESYQPKASASATRTATDLRDIPQAVSVVTEAQIEDQGLRSVGDALRGVPGAIVSLGEGNRDQIALRGNASTADFFVDGLRDDVQYYRGLYNLERIEVLKGPNAMIFGRGGGGGVVNRVTKRPEAKRFVRADATAGSDGAAAASLDASGVPADGVLARFNGVYERLDSFRDAYGGRRIGLNPTLALVPDAATRIDLSYEYGDDRRVADRGVPSAGAGNAAAPARPLEGFRATFFGARGVNTARFRAHVLHAALTHDFSDRLGITSRWLWGDYDKFYRNAFAATPVTPVAGSRAVGIEAYRDAVQRRNLFNQNDLVWRTGSGPVRQTLLAGFEWGRQRSRQQHLNGFFDSGVATANGGRRFFTPLADPIAIPAITFRSGTGARSVRVGADVAAAYVQDQVEIGAHVEIVAGLRRDRFHIAIDDLLAAASFARTDALWSPRLGLIVKPTKDLSLYASYSRSYLPQSGDQFASLDATLQALEPERFDNYEVGAKWTLAPGLLFTAAAYRLDRTNSRTADPADPTRFVLTGAQRSRGIELQLAGQVRPNWRVSAGYALQAAKIVGATSAAPAGRSVALVPRHQGSLWTRYDVSRALGLGAGIAAQSRTYATISNAVMLPGYARVDAAFYHRLTRGMEAQLNVENLLGADYFAAASSDNNILPGAPRTARLTLRFQF
jgi:catecholate siderophore receptor